MTSTRYHFTVHGITPEGTLIAMTGTVHDAPGYPASAYSRAVRLSMAESIHISGRSFTPDPHRKIELREESAP